MAVFGNLLLLSLDSLIAGLLSGIVLKRWRQRVGLAALFGIFDAIGIVGGKLAPLTVHSPPDVGLYALYVILVLLAALASPFWLLLMPVLLSVDNFLSGASIALAPASAITSAALALCGMALSCGALSLFRSLPTRKNTGAEAV